MLEKTLEELPEASPAEMGKLKQAFQALTEKDQEKALFFMTELVALKGDLKVIQAALVWCNPALQEQFDQTREIVESVSRLQELQQKALENKIDALSKILSSMARDLRIVLLASVNECFVLSQVPFNQASASQKQAAHEALEIYAPILHKLGISRLKNQVEDLAFKVIKPQAYEQISQKLEATKSEREQELASYQEELKKHLGRFPDCVIAGRVKHIYSIWRKIEQKKVQLEELGDLTALRVIVDTIPDCYAVLGVIHSIWNPLPGRFTDYIAKPKENGYQSLHTTVQTPNGKLLEIQIRTHEMHQESEFGIAAHFRYKGHQVNEKMASDKRLTWLREAISFAKSEEGNEIQAMDVLAADFFENEIFVFTPKGQVIELPENATPIDFAFAIHTSIGSHCTGCKVNGKMASLDSRLQNGDKVEIITSEKAFAKRAWLSFVQTAKAKTKIRSSLQVQSQEKTKKVEVEKPLNIPKIEITASEQKKIKLAKCCHPLPGDAVRGFLTTKRKIAVHKSDCQNIEKISENASEVKVGWNVKGGSVFEVGFQVTAEDHGGILTELMNAFSKCQASIKSARAKRKGALAECYFNVGVKNAKKIEEISRVLLENKKVKNVQRV